MHPLYPAPRDFSAASPQVRCLGAFVLAGILLLAGAAAGGTQPPADPGAELPPDALIDLYALATPSQVEVSLDWLVEHLLRRARTDRDKARAIFRWMTDRIHFDVNAFFTGSPSQVRPEAVLRTGRALGDGYAALFEAMARRAGLYAVTLPGHAKMKHHNEEGRFLKIKHAWNAVWLDGSWQFVDAAWGAGYVKLQRFNKVYQEQYFLTPPGQMILTHLPGDPRWQLLAPPVTAQQFDALPAVNVPFFSVNLSHKTGVQGMLMPGFRSLFAKSDTQLHIQAGTVKILVAPLSNPLSPGEAYRFVIEAPRATPTAQVALCNNDQVLLLHRHGTRYEATIRPEAGDLNLCVKSEPDDPKFQNVMTYKVK